MVVYIAGPMRGYPGFNFPAFDLAADALAALGHVPVSPAAHDRQTFPEHDWSTGTLPEGFTLAKAMEWDLQAILNADAIALLPGWDASEGVSYELSVARATSRKVFYLQPGQGNYRLTDDRQAEAA